jgi:hypothetical protein
MKERLYLFDTTLRDGARPVPSPLEGEGWGGGYAEFPRLPSASLVAQSAPPSRSSRMMSAMIDLPLKGRGNEDASFGNSRSAAIGKL